MTGFWRAAAAALALAAIAPLEAAADGADAYAGMYASLPAVTRHWSDGRPARYDWADMRSREERGELAVGTPAGGELFALETEASYSIAHRELERGRIHGEPAGGIRGRIGEAFDRFVPLGTGTAAYASAEFVAREDAGQRARRDVAVTRIEPAAAAFGGKVHRHAALDLEQHRAAAKSPLAAGDAWPGRGQPATRLIAFGPLPLRSGSTSKVTR